MSLDVAINQLKVQLPRSSWTVDTQIIAPHLKEWRDRWEGQSPLLILPRNTQEVVTAVNICREQNAPLCIQGGNTGLVGGQIPQGEILLSTQYLNSLRDQTTDSLSVESGMLLTHAHAHAKKNARIFPLSLASEGSATIGGLCATNAGGIHVVRYGSMRDLVLGVEVVLADGTVINSLNPLKKDNTGYDLTSCFIGAEGTLGIITAATLKLFPPPMHTTTLLLAMPSVESATHLLLNLPEDLRAELSVIELIPALAMQWVTQYFPSLTNPFRVEHPWYVLIEFDLLSSTAHTFNTSLEMFIAKQIDNNTISDAIVATTLEQSKQLKALRENISAAQKSIGQSIKHDVSVPIQSVSQFIQRACKAVEQFIPNCRPLPFGHIGDGNIHFNVMQPSNMNSDIYLDHWQAMTSLVHNIVEELGGSISAEHGIGILKKNELQQRHPQKVKHMKKIKNSLDPTNLLNPRVLFS